MKLELVTRKDVSCVELQKDDKNFLGIFFRDGIQDEAGPVVKNVKPKSPAAKSFAVAKGDVVLSVDGISTVGAKSKDVKRMLNASGPTVYLQLQYKTQEIRILESGVYRKQRLTTRLHKVDGSFGFVLRKNDSRYSFTMEYPIISNIKEGTQLKKSGQLQEGDRLLKVDGVSLSWTSLPIIASLMQGKDVAEFTFEYNVRVVDFLEKDTVDLEINAPVQDLGMSLYTTDGECSAVYVDSILPGSVAERCGVFSKGDIILSINDIDTKLLTASKAELLLRNCKRSRKISCVTRRKERLIEDLNEVSSCSTESEYPPAITPAGYSTNSEATTCGRVHDNTLASSNFYSSRLSPMFDSEGFSEKFKMVDRLQSTASSMSRVKQHLSVLTRKAFEKSQSKLNQNCMSCNQTEHAAKLCTSCLGSMNAQCAQSMDSLRNAVAYFVKLSTNYSDDDEEEQPENVSVGSTIRMLRELPSILQVPQLEEFFRNLADKMSSSNPSCSTCHEEMRSVMMLVQQLMLILSVADDSAEFQSLIEHLINCLLDSEFSCDAEDTDCTNFAPANTPCSSASVAMQVDSVSVRIDYDCSTPKSRARNNSETESNGIYNSADSDLNRVHIDARANQDFLKLTQSLSGSHDSVAGSASLHLRTHNTPASNTPTDLEEIGQDCRSVSAASSCHQADTEVKQTPKSFTFTKVWKSLDSFVRLRIPTRVDQSDCLSVPESRRTSRSSEVAHEDLETLNKSLQRHISSDKPHFNTPCHSVGEQTTSMSYLADVSSIYSSRTTVPLEPRKTHTETMKVELTNEGRGFGLDIIFDEDSGSKNPIIKFIEPRSPSHKIGILKRGDRILAVNSRSTCKLPPKQLHILKKRAFAASVIELVVEFDAYDHDYKFGIFDVVLDKSELKAGLIFEGTEFMDFNHLKKGSPMLVSGIAKGSAAHRCGQVFPGDKLKLFRSARNEDYNPISGDYDKKDVVVITVQRYPHEVPGVVKNSRSSSPASPVDTGSRREDILSGLVSQRNSSSFDLKKTAVRPHDKKGKFVLEHELTLYRDPSKCDFGFLVGEDPNTGRAYVTDIRHGGPAHKSGVIKKMDRIVEVDGVPVDSNSVLEKFVLANHKVDLLIQRTVKL